MNESSQEPNFNIMACHRRELPVEAWIRNFADWKHYRAAILIVMHSVYHIAKFWHLVILELKLFFQLKNKAWFCIACYV